jgi:hypothetical protein
VGSRTTISFKRPLTTNDNDDFQFTETNCTNKTDHHNITEILLKVALNTIKKQQTISLVKNLPRHNSSCLNQLEQDLATIFNENMKEPV